MIPLEFNCSRPKDNYRQPPTRRGKLLTGPMNRVIKGDSVKRGVGRLSIRTKRTDETTV